MIDRIFSAALALCLLATGAAAIGSVMSGADRHAAAARAAVVPVRIVQLERVVVTAKRTAPTTAVAKTEATEAAAPRLQ